MTRALALLVLEVRLERRYRIHAIAVFVAALWTVLLLAVPAPLARTVTPFILFADAATVGAFMLAAIVLFERGEGALSALLVAPVRLAEYMAAKVVALTGLALLIAAPVAAAGGRLDVRPLPVVAGVALTAVLLLLLCFALVAPHRTITGFLSVAPWPLVPLMGVPLVRLLGLAEHPVAFVVPTVGAVDLIATGFDPAVEVPALAIAYLLACTGVAGALAARRLAAHTRGIRGSSE